jgi:ABC-type polysaccharide/polyol phosphate transport system ATPase subunit
MPNNIAAVTIKLPVLPYSRCAFLQFTEKAWLLLCMALRIGYKKSYKNVPVLTGVDFQIKAGSIFALLGSNGAGKNSIFN